jgi:hypothetical protein
VPLERVDEVLASVLLGTSERYGNARSAYSAVQDCGYLGISQAAVSEFMAGQRLGAGTEWCNRVARWVVEREREMTQGDLQIRCEELEDTEEALEATRGQLKEQRTEPGGGIGCAAVR